MLINFLPNLQRTWVSVGIAGVGAAVKIGTGLHQNSLANQIDPQFTQYTTSPFAKEQLGTAKQLFNAPMYGAADVFRGIQGSEAGVNENAQRNATDSAQALAIASGAQGTANNSFIDFGANQGQYKMGLLNNLNSAYGAMINEGDKVYNSMFQKYQIDSGQQAALRGAGMGNIATGVDDISSGISLGQQSQQQNDFYNKLLALYGQK